MAPAIKSRGARRKKGAGKTVSKYGDEDYERARAVDDLIDQVIRTRYLSSKRPTVASVYENLQARILDENGPWQPSFHRYIIDPEGRDRRRIGGRPESYQHMSPRKLRQTVAA